MGKNHESTSGKPEGTSVERAWRSVLLDFPYFSGSSRLQSGGFRAWEAEKHRFGGRALGLACFDDYIARWVCAGFTPEMYWAVHQGLGAAVRRARQRCADQADRDRLGARLGLLGIEAPNPRAGQSFLFATGRDPETRNLMAEERLHPLHIVQLVPEAWAGFPLTLQTERPSNALVRFICGPDEG